MQHSKYGNLASRQNHTVTISQVQQQVENSKVEMGVIEEREIHFMAQIHTPPTSSRIHTIMGGKTRNITKNHSGLAGDSKTTHIEGTSTSRTITRNSVHTGQTITKNSVHTSGQPTMDGDQATSNPNGDTTDIPRITTTIRPRRHTSVTSENNRHTEITIYGLNVCGLNSKLDNGVLNDCIKKSDIFCISESKVSKGNHIDNYTVFN